MKHLFPPLLLRPLLVLGFVAGGLGTASAQSVYTTPYTISAFAGNPGFPGNTNGSLNNAQFGEPLGIAVDSSGNVYVADTNNDLIREITPLPGANVSTLAGTALVSGTTNGTTGSALFATPDGVTVDSAGNVYVADTGNNMIRKISGGNVTTIAGAPGVGGHADGTGSAASFGSPEGICVDAAGNIYVADEGSDTIRKITPTVVSGATTWVVTTIAGSPQVLGSANGTGSSALFSHPEGVTVDSAGNLYVADTINNTIRKITPSGTGGATTWTVTTLAGTAGVIGSRDGTGPAAQFYYPTGITVDSGGNVYVADSYNDTIRRVTPAGVTSTLAGSPGAVGSQTGTGAVVEFSQPSALAVDSSGNLYIADTNNSAIEVGAGPLKITQQPQDQTAILGGSATFAVAASGPSLTYQWQLNGAPITGAISSSYTVGSVQSSNSGSGNLYTVVVGNGTASTTSNSATITVSNVTAPTVTNPAGQTVNAGSTASFSVIATGGNITYQWYLNGTSISGGTGATLTLPHVGTSQAGYYSVSASNAAGSAFSQISGLLTVNYSARLFNLSSRANVGTGGNILIAGFATSGTTPKNLLLRGVGPTLALNPFFVPGALANPQLTLYDTSPAPGPYPIVTNIGWGNAFTLGTSAVSVSPQLATTPLMNSVGAFTIAPGSVDSALEVTPPIGNFTVEITGVGNTSGVALAEIYDADTGTPASSLVNISARANVGAGGNVLIGGFSIAGTTSETVLIRGVGPQLAYPPINLTGTLSTPQLTLLDDGHQAGESASEVIAVNTGWSNSPTTGPSPVLAGIQPATAAVMNTVGAFALNAGSADCAMVATLPPGNYSVEVGGIASTGIALVEIYAVP